MVIIIIILLLLLCTVLVCSAFCALRLQCGVYAVCAGVMFDDPLVTFDTTQATLNSLCVTFPFLWVIFDTPLHVI